jgi:hypothetical protein
MWPSRSWWLALALGCGLSKAAGHERVPATIYRCEIGESITFSDRPCDAGAQRYEPDLAGVSTYTPPRAAPVQPQQKKQGQPRRSGATTASVQAKHAEECARLRSNLKQLRSKMRAGYGAKEGERLRERQTKLQARLHAARC